MYPMSVYRGYRISLVCQSFFFVSFGDGIDVFAYFGTKQAHPKRSHSFTQYQSRAQHIYLSIYLSLIRSAFLRLTL